MLNRQEAEVRREAIVSCASAAGMLAQEQVQVWGVFIGLWETEAGGFFGHLTAQSFFAKHVQAPES